MNIKVLNPPEKQCIVVKEQTYAAAAKTTAGKNPEKQQNQDCAGITVHSKNYNLTMMLVADGLMDSISGDVASKTLTEALSVWFSRLSLAEINTPIVLEGKLSGALRELNNRMFKSPRQNTEATFALAIVGSKETLIANIGNCRCYTINKKGAQLQTTDNLKWYEYNSSELISPEETKFLIAKDAVNRTIGGYPNDKRFFDPYIQIVNNNSYDGLALTTHGVTDILYDGEIAHNVRNHTIETALEKTMYEVSNSEPKEVPTELRERFAARNAENMLTPGTTMPGESNATIAIYTKKI